MEVNCVSNHECQAIKRFILFLSQVWVLDYVLSIMRQRLKIDLLQAPKIFLVTSFIKYIL